MWRPALITLVVRVAVAFWGARLFPPAADGVYYDTLARRLASGQGYTWAWPDGAVTYAAHYPVGYPAILALFYTVLGASPLLAMLVHAVFGALSAGAVHALVEPAGGRRRALVAGLAAGLHPALLLYTPALMTEGVTSALLVVAAALGLRGRPVVAALVMGVAVLVRPQTLVLAPLLGLLVAPPGRRVRGTVMATLLALLVCAPWTVRNCRRMDRCALVSVNAGWNLLIGAQTRSGAWQEVDVPPPCRTVWDEAQKDTCFDLAARREILAQPLAWVARAPAKLAVTFDYFGGAPWYLHVSNAQAFPERAKLVSGVVETVVSRLILVLALLAGLARSSLRPSMRGILLLVGVVSACSRHAWPGYLVLVPLLVTVPAERGGLLARWTAGSIVATAAAHAVFFGAGRYGLVIVPLVTAVSALVPLPSRWGEARLPSLLQSAISSSKRSLSSRFFARFRSRSVDGDA